ncbi:MAG: hypothetical protein PHG55_02925 [Verrucomicrobiota bacterium]|jgi:hypothetical protein|nr:hypothetical protein [Verrucomicrobiota bacterium]
MRARSQPGQESIPTPTPIQAMIGLIDNHCLEELAFSDDLYLHRSRFQQLPGLPKRLI